MTGKVLIVVDDPNFALALELLFARHGCEVTTVHTAEEALGRMGEIRPRLLLVDGRLPFMSGFEMCQVVRAHREWHPLGAILLTANDRQPEAAKALALGADVCLTKPFSTRALLDAARGLLGTTA